MSYDLMVFELDAAPTDHAEFLAWYARKTMWSEDHDYNHPALTSAHLRAWFEEIIRILPPMNGPYATEPLPEDEASISDYAIGADFIYASFARSKAEVAYLTVARLAEKYQLGLFNASSTGEEVWIPAEGRMKLAHEKIPPSMLDWVGRLFSSRK